VDLITTRSVVVCDHGAEVRNVASQDWVRIEGPSVLVDDDPQARAIVACPNMGPTVKPCKTSLKVSKGYSSWIRIGSRAVVLDTLDGLTDGTVPGTVHYRVRDSRQYFTRADG
jgi:hypothetical protein